MQTGQLAGLEAILDRAAEVGARVLVDATQAIPFVPLGSVIDRVDYLVAAAYKHLLCPRGVAFLAGTPERLAALSPLDANWRSADSPYGRYFGGPLTLACIRRSRRSLAWMWDRRGQESLPPRRRAAQMGVDGGAFEATSRCGPECSLLWKRSGIPWGRGIARLRADAAAIGGRAPPARRRHRAASRGDVDKLFGPRLTRQRRHRARGPSHRTVPDPLTHGSAMFARGVPLRALDRHHELDHARGTGSAMLCPGDDINLAFRTGRLGWSDHNLHQGNIKDLCFGHPVLGTGNAQAQGRLRAMADLRLRLRPGTTIEEAA
jgi:hypothetical protein